MKALTLIQPWASALIAGMKTFETRSWPTQLRGRIAIHASQNRKAGEFRSDQEPFAPMRKRGQWPAHRELPFGGVIGVVTIAACVPTSSIRHCLPAAEIELGNYEVGRFAWRLENPIDLDCVLPCKGALGLWTLPHHIEEQLEIGIEVHAATTYAKQVLRFETCEPVGL